MNENIKVRWLTDSEQTKVAPKTLSSQVYNEDGTRFKDEFDTAIVEMTESIDEGKRQISDHANNTEIHVTPEEKEAWSSIEVPSLDGYATEDYVKSLVKSLNSNLALRFYCVEDVTIITNGVSTIYPANSNVEVKFLDTDVFEIVPTSDNSILTLEAFPGALGTYYPWLEGVRQFSNILFDMNNVDFYSKWSQGNQGLYQVQFAQYTNCIFWSDNPYISDVTKRTNYTLYYTSQLPLCYSTIPDNTFKTFFLALGVNNDPNWGNPAYRDSFAKATWATQAFSYYGARMVGLPGLDSSEFNIVLPKDCRGLMFDAINIESAGVFDATNTTNFGAKSGSWRDAFGNCSSLRKLYIKNLKVNLNISWSPIDYRSIYYIISESANTNAITISVSPYTYNLLGPSDFELAASKNITIELLTTNYVEDRRWSHITDKFDTKVDKEDGKGLSTNDYTDEDKNKLADMSDNIDNISALVGDVSVSEQIANANIIYVGPSMPEDPNIKVWINTAEEGTGIVPVLPRIATITLDSSNWSGDAAPYSQVVDIATVTSSTKIDLQPTASQIVALQNADIALMAENNNGVVTVYSFGGKLADNMSIQAILTEVSYV